jgi:hypothetical protein
MTKQEDQFQVWLMDMSDAIERFQQSLPNELRGRLDYSPESLDVLEGFALTKYPSPEDAKKPSEAAAVDGMARYVGEVFIKRLGGRWMIDHSNPKNAFYGLPQLSGMAGQQVQLCPLTLVTASLDRRTGSFIRQVFDNNRRNAGFV